MREINRSAINSTLDEGCPGISHYRAVPLAGSDLPSIVVLSASMN